MIVGPGRDQWFKISDETYAELLPIAEGRDRLSDAAENTRRWTSDFNLTGLIGESLYAHLTGLPLNKSISIRDGGEDFPGIDIKTTKIVKKPQLLAPRNFKFRAAKYVLIVYDKPNRRASVAGWCTREEFQRAPLVKQKYGLAYTLQVSDLHVGIPG